MGDTSTDLFLDRYKKLEETCREAFNMDATESALVRLKHMKQFRGYAEDIDYCREVRNFLTHNPKLGDEYPITPSKKMVEFIDSLIERVAQRKRCIQIAVKGKEMHTCVADDKLDACMTIMREKSFSHMPITESGRVVGVLDLHAAFGAFADMGSRGSNDELTVGDLSAYTNIHDKDGAWEHPDFMGEVYGFFSINMYVDELESEFERWFKQGRRLGMAFLTQNGKQNETLLGLVTAWDILGNPNG